MIVLPWQAQAGMIATDQALGAAQVKVAGFLQRDEVAAQLERLGVSPKAAQDRVAALTDAQVATLADRIDALPAGGDSLLAIIVVVWLIVYFLWFSPGALLKDNPAPAGKAAAKSAPAKPAPEKK
jgi:hypothetical protein